MMDMYYLQDSRSCVGDRMMFWAKGGAGYTTDLGRAQRFTSGQAVRKNQSRETDIPWPVSYIEARHEVSVDHQDISQQDASSLLLPGAKCTIQVTGHWNGNDILFSGWGAERTYDFNRCWKAPLAQAEDVLSDGEGTRRVIWPLEYLNSKVRRVCAITAVRRQAIARAGISLAQPRHCRRKPDVFNCEGCGRYVSGTGRYLRDCTNCGTNNCP
ncbi:hypothetical protein [Pseudomonas sp.]|jgi:hypothetical protein|uniref:hypothetical protein n=1 Tax=Pseudomonas sp. TaxID=306 RepID=UPI002EDBA065